MAFTKRLDSLLLLLRIALCISGKGLKALTVSGIQVRTLEMLKIWELKKAADAKKAIQKTNVSAGQLRAQADINSLELPHEMGVEFPDPSDLMQFLLTYTPQSGFYEGGHFIFKFSIPPQYPIEPPRVRIQSKIWHPNIDTDGALCLNILREDWKPVLSLNHIAMGIQFLFLEPNKNDPLNKDAAASLQRNSHQFALEVRRAMHGDVLYGIKYDNVMS